MEPKELLSNLTSRGDVAAAALGFAAGFAVDVFLYAGGVAPGTTASVYAVGTVGLKNAIQAFLEGRETRLRESNRREALGDAAESLRRFMEEREHSDLATELGLIRELWDKAVLSDSDFEEALTGMRSRLREEYLRRTPQILSKSSEREA